MEGLEEDEQYKASVGYTDSIPGTQLDPLSQSSAAPTWLETEQPKVFRARKNKEFRTPTSHQTQNQHIILKMSREGGNVPVVFPLCQSHTYFSSCCQSHHPAALSSSYLREGLQG